MPTKAVLIIGGSGFVGSQLALRMRDSFKVFATHNTSKLKIPGVTFLPLVTSNRQWIRQVVHMAKPDVVIYAVGERRTGMPSPTPESPSFGISDLERLHAEGAANVLNGVETMQPKFIYLSSAYVFDGARGNYHENDPALPGTPLGKAKTSGENYIRGRFFHSVIVRSSPLFGRSNGWNFSFMDRLRMSLDRRAPIELDNRETHSFAPVDGFVDAIIEIAIQNQVRGRTLHYGGLTKITKFEFGQAFAKRFGYDPKLVTPATAAPTGRNQIEEPDFSLNSTAIAELLKIKPLLLQESFDLIEKNLVPRL